MTLFGLRGSGLSSQLIKKVTESDHVIAGSEEDVEYYVRECGDILGVLQKLPVEARSAKHILEHVFAQVVEFKKLNQVHLLNICRESNTWQQY